MRSIIAIGRRYEFDSRPRSQGAAVDHIDIATPMVTTCAWHRRPTQNGVDAIRRWPIAQIEWSALSIQHGSFATKLSVPNRTLPFEVAKGGNRDQIVPRCPRGFPQIEKGLHHVPMQHATRSGQIDDVRARSPR
jgi:hypothetical protein